MAFVDDGRALGLCNSGDFGGDDNDDGLDRWSKKRGAPGRPRLVQLPEERLFVISCLRVRCFERHTMPWHGGSGELMIPHVCWAREPSRSKRGRWTWTTT